VYAGAQGETASQLADILHFPGPQADLHPAIAELGEHIQAIGQKEEVELSIANSLWTDQALELRGEFANTTYQYYQANVFPVDFSKKTEKSRQRINTWVAEHTKHKIEELLQPGDLSPVTVLALINAIYFKGNWQVPFEEERTTEAPFFTPEDQVHVPTMHHQGTFDYAEDTGVQILALPYADERLSMVILLPNEPDGLAELEWELDAEFIMQLLDRLQPQKVEISLPKFGIRARLPLLEILRDMGWNDLSDFSGIAAASPFLSEAIHEAYVDINEQGTEAAAATAVMMGRSISRFIEFNADHPFIFLIVDHSSSSILFIGRLVNPKAL
jgi:serpin B